MNYKYKKIFLFFKYIYSFKVRNDGFLTVKFVYFLDGEYHKFIVITGAAIRRTQRKI